MTHTTVPSVEAAAEGSGIAFWSTFSICFVLLLVTALLALLLTWNWRQWLPVSDGEKSLIHGVKSAVYSFMPYIT